MTTFSYHHLRGLALLGSGIFAAILIVYLLVNPSAFTGLHPIPLIFLLLITVIIAVWQAIVLLT